MSTFRGEVQTATFLLIFKTNESLDDVDDDAVGEKIIFSQKKIVPTKVLALPSRVLVEFNFTTTKVDPEQNVKVQDQNTTKTINRVRMFSDLPLKSNSMSESLSESRYQYDKYGPALLQSFFSNDGIFSILYDPWRPNKAYRVSRFSMASIKYFVGAYQVFHEYDGVHIIYKLKIEVDDNNVPVGCLGIHYDDGRPSIVAHSRDHEVTFIQLEDRHQLLVVGREYNVILSRFIPASEGNRTHAIYVFQATPLDGNRLRGEVEIIPIPKTEITNTFCSNPDLIEND